jgi:acetyl-CoA carboxylase biotin carboxyl carrier protein
MRAQVRAFACDRLVAMLGLLCRILNFPAHFVEKRVLVTPSSSDNAQPEKQPAENSSNWLTQPEALRELAFLARDEKLSELEVCVGDTRLEFKAAKPKTPRARKKVVLENEPDSEAPETVADEISPDSEIEEAPDAGLLPVVSPMVGIFYRAPSPSDPPFVEVGDTVEAGQTVGLVETMKVFNEITSDHSGTVAEILKDSGQLVETGETLITLKQ